MKTTNGYFKLIELKQSVEEYATHIHASHVLFWTKDNSRNNETVIYALMQMRSDGRFGFPGGKSDEEYVDEREIVRALYREIYEEMNYTLEENQISIEDRVFTHLDTKGRVLHFFAKELPLHVFQTLESTHMTAQSFPNESLGLIRIPLSSVGHQSYQPFVKFFTGFLNQKFAGNAKNQLIGSLINLKLIGESDMKFVFKTLESD